MDIVLFLLLPVVLSAIITWFITHRYYKKSLSIQESQYSKEIKALIRALQEKNSNDGEVINQQYIDKAVNAWKIEGTAEHYLNSLEINTEKKAEIYRAACLRHKKREPKRNPYDS